MNRKHSLTYPVIFATSLTLASVSSWAAQPAALGTGVPCGGAVTVESGDSLGDIAALCGVASRDIQSVNPDISDWNLLYPGQRLVVPAAVAVAVPGEAALDQLLAPYALYPDALLAEILPASTYPLELVQAERWTADNPGADPDSQGWAPAVAALTRYPEVLSRLSGDLDNTIQIGDAFLADPDTVFATIQDLRERAQSAGTLATNEYQEVIVEPVETVTQTEYVEPVVEVREVIRIVPRYSSRIYVPTYDPYWAYHYHPNYYSVFRRPVFSFGIHYGYGAWLSHYINWSHYHVGVFPIGYRSARYHYYPSRYYRSNLRSVSYWHHQPQHRRGYRYIAQPRVRISEGQRHLVRVSQVRNPQRTGRVANAYDYRANERNRAIARTDSRRNDTLANRIRSNDARNTSGARTNQRSGGVATTDRRTTTASQNRQQRAQTSSRRTAPAEDRGARIERQSRTDQQRISREATLNRLRTDANRRAAPTRTTRNAQTTTRSAAPTTTQRNTQATTRRAAPTTTQRLTTQRSQTSVTRNRAPTTNRATPRREVQRAAPVQRAPAQTNRQSVSRPSVTSSRSTQSTRQSASNTRRSEPAQSRQQRSSTQSRSRDSSRQSASSSSRAPRASQQRERERR